MNSSLIRSLGTFSLLTGVGAAPAVAAHDVVSQGATTELRVASDVEQPAPNYAGAIPLEVPAIPPRSASDIYADTIEALGRSEPGSPPRFSKGSRGNGKQHPIALPKGPPPGGDGVVPQEFGTTSHPFASARNDSPTSTNTSYPARAAGKLFFNIGTASYMCSASLIKRGIAVTAAHCVAGFGSSQYYSNWQFVPGYRNGAAPYGTWTAASARVLTSYLNGTDPCSTSGVVCRDDVAVLTLRAQGGSYPGTSTGWYGYGYDGYGYTGAKISQVTQLGYPACLDNGKYQIRNDSYSYVSGSNSNNSVIGSLMCGGSSGGPWLVNYGIRPSLTGTAAGTAADPNVVIGVTSWGYSGTGPKEMGASPFTSGNIKALVDAACAATPAACN